MANYWGEAPFPTRGEMKKHADSLSCPTCDSPVALRWRKADSQPFYSCTRYHEDGCIGAYNWTGDTGFTNEVWEDTLKEEGKIDTDTSKQMSLPDDKMVKYWRDRYFEEKQFTMTKLHDIANAYRSHRDEFNKELEELKKRVNVLEMATGT